jgi:DNA invertase Pin-like site-specific DNA recombinase
MRTTTNTTPKADKFVAYYRVSTARQGRSGLGLEAQRAAVLGFLKSTTGRLLAEFTEVESGKVNERPKLAEAILRAKVTGSRLLIAKMDRLSRNAAFLLTLRDSGVRFVAADLPNADETVVGIMAVVAQNEREMIARRTREALAVARRRLSKDGLRLGNPNGAKALREARKGNKAAVAEIVRTANERAKDLRDVIADIQACGHLSFSAIADELNRREIETPRGGRWYPASVARLKARLGS